jgi:hypothetical protein
LPKPKAVDLKDCAVYARDMATPANAMANSIGFSTIRGGDIVGDHTVMFAHRGRAHRDHPQVLQSQHLCPGQFAGGAFSGEQIQWLVRHVRCAGLGSHSRLGMNFLELLTKGDALTRLVALVLLLMSVLSWMTIIYKTVLLRAAVQDLAACKAWLLASL